MLRKLYDRWDDFLFHVYETHGEDAAYVIATLPLTIAAAGLLALLFWSIAA
jgi:hypothetical protein